MKTDTLLNRFALTLYNEDNPTETLSDTLVNSLAFAPYRAHARSLLKSCSAAGIIIFRVTDLTTYTFKRTQKEVLYRSIESNRETIASQHTYDPNKDMMIEADEMMISDLFERLRDVTFEE